MKRTPDNQILRFAIATALVCGISAVYSKWGYVNRTTVGFSFLLAILVVSAAWGFRYAIFMALLVTLAYN